MTNTIILVNDDNPNKAKKFRDILLATVADNVILLQEQVEHFSRDYREEILEKYQPIIAALDVKWVVKLSTHPHDYFLLQAHYVPGSPLIYRGVGGYFGYPGMMEGRYPLSILSILGLTVQQRQLLALLMSIEKKVPVQNTSEPYCEARR